MTYLGRHKEIIHSIPNILICEYQAYSHIYKHYCYYLIDLRTKEVSNNKHFAICHNVIRDVILLDFTTFLHLF